MKKNIFLSRPNWIDPEYEEGLTNFLNLLGSHELIPRTIGKTDYPNKSPMDGVIDLLHECEGAIILGYPQIKIETGYLKNNAIKSTLVLPTEWNHIEAGLAHSLGLPLLIIHDNNVARGIFDRGVLSNFLYEKDLKDSAWALSQDISGALISWKSTLQQAAKPKQIKSEKEVPKPKWGCFTFPPDENLYCPFCYNNKGEKYLTNRIDGKFRQCTSCGRKIPSG